MKVLTSILFLCKVIMGTTLTIDENINFVIKIEPKSNNRGALRNRDSLRRMERGNDDTIVRQGIINVTQTNKLLKSRPEFLHVKFFPDDEDTLFERSMDWDDESGFYWFGENETSESSFNIQIHDDKYTGYAVISGKVYSIVTESDGIVVVQEVDVTNLPNEADEGHEEAEEHPSFDRNLAQQSSFQDSGETIDILCLYTRQALIGMCEMMQGRNCVSRYTNYIPAMNDRCQFAVHQTVSSKVLNYIITIPLQAESQLTFCFHVRT